MTPERDIERVLTAWLEPGPSTMPDRVFDAVVDQIEGVPQRRVLRPIRRSPGMSITFKLAAAVVLLLVVVAVTRPLQPGPSFSGPSPSPLTLPSPTPRAPVLPTSFAALDPGTYAFGSSKADVISRISATVPQGWSGIRGTNFANLFQNADEFPEGSISVALPDNFFIDPCNSSAGLMDPPLGPTVDDFVTALANAPGYRTTEPVATSLFGYSGKHLDEIGPASVADCADGFAHPWHTKNDETAPYDQDAQHHRVWVLDVDGVRVVFDLVGSNAAPHPTGGDPVSLAEQQQVFESIQIAPASSPTLPASPPASQTATGG